jgi:hypothetical protein
MGAIDWQRGLRLPRLFRALAEEPSHSFGYPHGESG